MSYVIVSRTFGGTLKIEGQGYSTTKEAEKFIKLFKARIAALDKVQKEFFKDSLVDLKLEYTICDSKVLTKK